MKEKIYNENILTDVIFEMKFPPILELMDGENLHVSKFQKKIVDKFPYLDIKKDEEITLNVSQISSERKKITSWLFKDKDNSFKNNNAPTKIVSFNYNQIVLHYKNSYSNFNDFLETIYLIFDALSEYSVRKTKYISMRYVNQIKLENNENWNGLINKNLCFTSDFVKNNVLRSMHSLEFKEEDYVINFNFGEFNSDYPHPISKKEFVLDYICKYKESTDIEDVSKIAKKMNELIHEWFEKSILKGLRDIIG
ncbi:MAG: TIGR04255 family protein [Methanobrevibacter sp.]|jgi:uncharacterized protein (TIGR04255 family)|nr:TIGR04255 family protein [Candidatus Methanovirga meridionalis]